MPNRLKVSTKCPSCGAPLDFSEGSNAVQCLFCQSNLLVTGRKQLLSYYIAPKLNIHRAVAKTSMAHKANGHPCRIINPQLYFIPYYRLTGHDLRWEEEIPEKKPYRSDFRPYMTMYADLDDTMFRSSGGGLFSAFQKVGDFLERTFGGSAGSSESSSPPICEEVDGAKEKRAARSSSVQPYTTRKVATSMFNDKGVNVSFRDRYVEKNFAACNMDGYGIYSLGVRPNVLRLELFQRETVKSIGKIVGPKMAPGEALARGMKTAKSRPLLYRRVLGQILSVIYFPFWVVEVKQGKNQRITILDAVTENVMELEGSTKLYEILEQQLESTAQTIDFRPLVCPNCGWDLPVRADDVIFVCSSCRRVWQIYGSRLYEVQYRIASLSGRPEERRVSYLPFWVLDTEIKKESPSRFYLPAFRFPRLKTLKDLAWKITNNQPQYTSLEGEVPDLHGCFYDQEDAVKFAQMTYMAMSSKYQEAIKVIEEKEFKISGLELIWFPFTERGLSLVDPFTGFAIPRNLLV